MASKITYTAQEMREEADTLDEFCRVFEKKSRTPVMLRYAAEVLERYDAAVKLLDEELSKQKRCRDCEWRGETIRSEPACPCPDDEHQSVFEIDITDRFEKVLRGDAGKEVSDGK